MTSRCPACSAEVSPRAAFCPSCGRALHDEATRTAPAGERPSGPDPTPRRTSGDGRFVPGTVLAGRYRIVTLVGRGGMGEVYKADDLRLDHPVALKFLPDTLALNSQALARFHTEVRIARQVSHPNVCRVYDIGDVDGLHFLTMELVDGEDLGSLLRRIKRLPADKAVEVARQISAGLAAAHDAGILHRDLKPANVMIDGRGRARLMDFGVAAVARDVRGEDGLAGTPAYMAPELLKGQDASVRSDIYALGLVLYEIFTGRKAVEARTVAEAALHHSAGSTVSSPSNWVADLDPVVERAIMRCLDRDPSVRPASAIQVAAALPGGDPLQAALLAGETPSPEMVAAAGSTDAWRPRVGLMVFVLTTVALLISAWGGRQFSMLAHASEHLSPDVLVYQAREILRTLGHVEPRSHSAYGFSYNLAYLVHDRAARGPEDRQARLRIGRPPVIQFWYREGAEPLLVSIAPRSFGPPRLGPVTADNPVPNLPGMRRLLLDGEGRLTDLLVASPESDATSGPAGPMDWDALFGAAGLERPAFQSADPAWTPPVAFDERAAWTGMYPERPDLPLRLEAASYRGRLVALRSLGPWHGESASERVASGRERGSAYEEAVLLTLALCAVVLAWINLRSGRGDRRGALRLAAMVCSFRVGEWLLAVDHVAAPQEAGLFRLGMSLAIFDAVGAYLVYVALEPIVRRRWPQTLVAWTRALAGRVRDPLVGREVAVGAVLAVLFLAVSLAVAWSAGGVSDRVLNDSIATALSLRRSVAAVLTQAGSTIFLSLLACFLVMILRVLLRSATLAGVALVAFEAVAGLVFSPSALVGLVFGAVSGLLTAVAVTRFGLLALAIMTFLNFLFAFLFTTLAWSSSAGALLLAGVLALIGWACYVAIGSPAILPRPAAAPGGPAR